MTPIVGLLLAVLGSALVGMWSRVASSAGPSVNAGSGQNGAVIRDDYGKNGWMPFFLKKPVRIQFIALEPLENNGIGYGGYLCDWTYVSLEVSNAWVWRCYNGNLAAIGAHPYVYRMTPDGELTWRPGDAELVAAHSPWDRRDGKPIGKLHSEEIRAAHQEHLVRLGRTV